MQDENIDINIPKIARRGIYTHSDIDQIRAVIHHEIGHSLGILGHTTTVTDIMYYANDAQSGLDVTANEINNLRLLYDSLC